VPPRPDERADDARQRLDPVGIGVVGNVGDERPVAVAQERADWHAAPLPGEALL
jgi:hypothetical protein